MNQKERRECVFNLYENKVNFEIFENILNKIGCHKGGLVPAINRMSIDDWVKHYKEYCENIIITKEQIVITFDYLEKYYNGFIKKSALKLIIYIY
ncbi:MAG: hypothetical protein M0D53_17675 [Flavobacterium sp. JAD_PAG50586_2]|nr:MAG: hypothetical protein M0D53_17675 [Flavobacterium sp. JAD_PAG50586_2]